ncbi:hypothetical protein S40285_09489 [Stachybotrys chlorohalonatus IBT 40285]|uniref:Uncharacterized protein n=1 Tax=Stachybotrys chlorohalonatus (strain IBT 40285) TaxID=1283841 RepID=A0A084QS00_STAC4|nr:hypothetical protein S40285_09489 [Stachybotrys chlorohalonata IBT 40285]
MDQALINRDDSGYVFLKSTLYSSACPAFRHGLIAIPKAKHFGGCSLINYDVDWAAFQAAILGTGHMFEDLSGQEDALLAEDISAWFTGFGFAHPGFLLSAPTSIRTPTSVSMKKSEQSVANPGQAEGRLGGWVLADAECGRAKRR